MINFLILLYRLLKGRRYARTVAPYDFGSPDDPQAAKSYKIWCKSMGYDE